MVPRADAGWGAGGGGGGAPPLVGSVDIKDHRASVVTEGGEPG
jgi:hypothetical protein